MLTTEKQCNRILRVLKHKLNPPRANLLGDRDVEWTFVASRIGRYANKDSYVLDFGCDIGTLSHAAAI